LFQIHLRGRIGASPFDGAGDTHVQRYRFGVAQLFPNSGAAHQPILLSMERREQVGGIESLGSATSEPFQP
jgi:hypothetical protein